MELLERQDSLNELSRLVEHVSAGEGCTVLLSGEAGIGKTSLIKYFTDGLNSDIEILWGYCDALFTPRPLGPLYDIAHQMKSTLINLLEKEEKRSSIFDVFLKYLERKTDLTVIVIEDIHWADEATLDLLKYTCRRINRTKCLLILSYRDNEIGPDHPLKIILGELPNSLTKRIRLYPLSENAVNELMKNAGISDDSLYKRTAGNPFFVTEILLNKSDEIPLSIKDAVNSRIAKLSDTAKRLLEVLSIIPSRINLTLLVKLFDDPETEVSECVNSGTIFFEKDFLTFRHELSRLAVADSIPLHKQISLHQKVLDILLESDQQENNLARIVHHASNAKNKKAIIKYAPLAAEQSSLLGAHREAVSYYSTLLEYSDGLTDSEQADYLDKYSYECYLTDQLDNALEARKKSLKIRIKLNEPVNIGSSYRWLSRISWFLGKKKDADNYVKKAIDTLETTEDKKELAWAYSNYSQLKMLDWNTKEAILWGNKAIDFARETKDQEIESHALNNVGTSELQEVFNNTGESHLLKSLRNALDKGFEEHAARAYTNLGCLATMHKKYSKGRKYLDEGIQYCINHDLDSWALYMKAWLARLNFEIGNWNEAGDIAQEVLSTNRLAIVSRIPAVTTLGWLRLRRGDPDSTRLLDEINKASLETGELQRIGPVTAALLEALWLNNESEKCIQVGKVGYELSLQKDDPWVRGQLAFWLWKCGGLSDYPDDIPEPYLKQLKGDWKSAAKLWKELGCPYEQALALTEGDERAKLDALSILESLGAVATVNQFKQQMRQEGIKNIPKGPRASTKQNPAGLTIRQLEVLKLLPEGLSNSEIASKLFISPKTVDHHISAILAKLNLHTRAEAAKFAQTNDI